jgi:PTH1 family peptidyl-tRNA hydrolase
LASVIYHLRTEEISRLRIGIGPLPEEVTSTEFVLGVFPDSEAEKVEEIISRAVDAILLFVAEGALHAMSVVNDPAFGGE